MSTSSKALDNSQVKVRIERLPVRCLMQLSRLLRGFDPDHLASILPRNDVGPLPLSYGQSSIWFMEQVYARTTTYSLPIVLEWGEGLEVEAFGRSLRELVRRHEILRTTFGVMNGVPVQRVGAAGAVALEVVEEAGETDERLRQEMGRPFDLERGPLLRAVLGRRSGGWTLLLNLHHIIADGWSVGIVKQELGALYAAYVQGRPSPLPELRIQYGDYAVWQRLWLEGERLQRLVEYWEQQLAGAPEVLALPVDRARPAMQSTRGASRGFRLSGRLLMGVKELARREGVTEFMVLTAAFLVLLERHTGQTDVVIGVPMAMRERTELEPLIGYFVNMLVLRTEVGGDPSFQQLLDRVRQVTLAAYEHQDLPFEQLVSALKVRRSAASTPVFQVVFALQNLPVLEGWGLLATRTGDELWVGEPIEGTAKFDLTMALLEAAGELVGTMEYRTELFEAETIEQLIRRYAELLERAVAKPECRLSELLQLTGTEQAELAERCQRSMPVTLERVAGEDDQASGPSTAVEAILVRIWREVLERSQIGLGENFFDIGGNSINAVRVMARLRDSLQVELPLHAIFEAPTIRTLAQLIEVGRAAFIEGVMGDECDTDPKQAVDSETAFTHPKSIRRAPLGPLRTMGPVSFAQERLWFLDQLEGSAPLYNVLVILPFPVSANVAALERALTEVVRRHEALRTIFTSIGGVPYQVVLPVSSVALSRVDISVFDEAQRLSEARSLSENELRRPFDLATGPLFRPTLVTLGRLGHWLLLSMHHIIVDGWSVNILVREIQEIFDALCHERPLPPDPEVQYLDFARWQRRYLKGQAIDRHLAYWRSVLAGASPVLELPTDRVRPAVESHRGAVLKFDLTPDVASALRALARSAHTTLFCVFVAAFKILLARLSGSDDIVLGTPVANRTRVEIEPLIGLFANTLVLRTNLSGEPNFFELLDRVTAVVRGATEHQDLPFERLVEALQPVRSLSHNPLFQIMIVFHDTTRHGASELQESASSSAAQATPLTSGTAKFDLTLSLADTGNSVSGAFEYNTDLFDAETVTAFISQFSRLLSSIAAGDDREIWLLPTVNDAEQARIISTSSQTRLPPAKPAHQAVSRLAGRSSNRLAVVHGSSSLTYGELDRRSDRLAAFLVHRGINPGDRVGILMDRGLDMCVAVLAALKAGAACVPIDRAYPPKRQAFLIADSRAVLLLTDMARPDRLLEFEVATDLVVINDPGVTNFAEVGRVVVNVGPEDIAYVMYTSGSTGRPKGVAMPHRSLGHLVDWQMERSGTAADRTLQFAPLSFDVAFQEIFSTWAAGGTLVLIDEASRRDPNVLVDTLVGHRVSRIFLPYVALQQMAEELAQGTRSIPSLQEVITAGEQVHITPAIREMFRRHPGAVLRNQYGPTETHVVTEYELTGHPAEWPPLPPIGRPLPHARVHVLDARQRPVSVGAVGELYIAGDCLATGYVNRPIETAKRFVEDPWSGIAGARMYRTGDLGRLSRRGELHFVGRTDDQLKIRGYRVEPGEVEAVLGGHPEVSEAVVVGNGRGGTQRLIAYVKLKSAIERDDLNFRDYLRARLPEFMVPASVHTLAELPRTPSGKIDRAALPNPTSLREIEAAGVGPETPLEAALHRRWTELLRLSSIGVDVDVFNIGAHSLMAVQFVAWLRTTVGRDVSVRQIFEHPTVRGLARSIVDEMVDEIGQDDAGALLDEVERRCGVVFEGREGF
jgi:amino acid adenylation domain-containing protein